MKISDFLKSTITDKVNLIAGGEECWIEVTSTNTDKFAKAKNQFDQAMSAQIISGKELLTEKVVLGQTITEKSDDYEKLLSILMSAVIVDWSFEDELNLESAAIFLYNNPAVKNKVDEVSAILSKEEFDIKKLQLPQQKENSDS